MLQEGSPKSSRSTEPSLCRLSTCSKPAIFTFNFTLDEVQTLLLLQSCASLQVVLAQCAQESRNAINDAEPECPDTCTFKTEVDLKSLLDDVIVPRGRKSCRKVAVLRFIEHGQENLSLQPMLRTVRKIRNLMAHKMSVSLQQGKDFLKAAAKLEDHLCTESDHLADLPNPPVALRQGMHKYHIRFLTEIAVSRAHVSVKVVEGSPGNVRIADSLPKVLVGRNALLHTLISWFAESSENTTERAGPPLRLLLHGPPGVGKTALVRALAFRLRSIFTKQFLFSSRTAHVLTSEMSCFKELELEPPATTPREVCESAFHFASTGQEKQLYIVEDVSDPSLVTDFITRTKHSIIFTSGSEHLWLTRNLIPQLVRSVRVEPLNTSDSFQLARKVFEGVSTRAAFDDLFKTCGIRRREQLEQLLQTKAGNCPLAVRLLAFQLAYDGVSIEDLSNRFSDASCQRSANDIKAAGPVHVRGYYHLVRHALEILSGTLPRVLALCLALLPPDGAPCEFVQLLGFRLGLSSDDVVGYLRALSTVGLIDMGERVISMHSIIQVHVRFVLLHQQAVSLLSVKAVYEAIRDVVQGNVGANIGTGDCAVRMTSAYCVTLKKVREKHAWTQMNAVLESFLNHAEELRLHWSNELDLLFSLLRLTTPFDHDQRRLRLRRKKIFERIWTLAVQFASDLGTVSTSPMTWMALLETTPLQYWMSRTQELLQRLPRDSLLYIDRLNEFLETLLAKHLCIELLLLLQWLGETAPQLAQLYCQTQRPSVCRTLFLCCQALGRVRAFKQCEDTLLYMASVYKDLQPPQRRPVLHYLRESAFALADQLVHSAGEKSKTSNFKSCHEQGKALAWLETAYFLCIQGSESLDIQSTLALCSCQLTLKLICSMEKRERSNGLVDAWLTRMLHVAQKTSLTEDEVETVISGYEFALKIILAAGPDSPGLKVFCTLQGLIQLLDNHTESLAYRLLEQHAPVLGLIDAWLKSDASSFSRFTEAFFTNFVRRTERDAAHVERLLRESVLQTSFRQLGEIFQRWDDVAQRLALAFLNDARKECDSLLFQGVDTMQSSLSSSKMKVQNGAQHWKAFLQLIGQLWKSASLYLDQHGERQWAVDFNRARNLWTGISRF